MACTAPALFVTPGTDAIRRPSLFRASNKKISRGVLRAKFNLNGEEQEDDPLFQEAIARASLRFRESRRPEPLFIDPYAGCFVPPDIVMDMNHNYIHNYCVATKFIDDELLHTLNKIDGFKQVVLLTDGMDTRPYRLNWPTSTMIFDISPERLFRRTAQKLQDVRAKIPRGCLLIHVPMESFDIQQLLHSKGFNGNRPSSWVFQGLPVMSLARFEEILLTVSNLATKGSFFLGELPVQLAETESSRVETIFVNKGFRVDMIGYDEVARKLGKEKTVSEDYKNILFVSEHLRFSDDQMEFWRKEFQRIEEDADEEGFEEL